MFNNKINEAIIESYSVYLRKLGYCEAVCKACALNKLRYFTKDKNFADIDINDLKNLFLYLKAQNKLSDAYLSSIGTELRRFFKYLRNKGINDNLMYNLVIPAYRRERYERHVPIDVLKKAYLRFHPRK
ncbi:MAG: hypothetical protein PHI59_07955 [Candidatus Omnitrophica bacterium]|nr:hypothetical protein [Candidatus Omnitrophota bacterium]